MNKSQNLFTSIHPDWKDVLRTDTTYSEPGFIGSVPILLLLRALTLGGIVVRFWLHGKLSLMFFVLIGLALILGLIVAVITYSKWKYFRRVQILFVLGDIVLISAFYWLTTDLRSDLFLFYFLPLLTAAEYFDAWAVMAFGIVITCVFGAVVMLLIPPATPVTERTNTFLGVFLIREFFFVLIVGALSWRRIGRKQRLSRLISALHQIGRATGSALEFDSQLDDLLRELTQNLDFEFASISLVDDYLQTIRMIRGVNIPPGWILRSKYRLEDEDIQADIVRTGQTEIIEGPDRRFNLEIYERFGHANVVRVFAPLIDENVVVGTIEAGCRRERRAEILTDEKVRIIERLGKESAPAIARARPHVLLELIANHAIGIIGADSASIHVYQLEMPVSKTIDFKEPLLEAGAGLATKAFLQEFPPRADGIGSEAMQTGRLQVVDRVGSVKIRHAAIYKKGVRAIAAFPLSLGTSIQGVLYVHFWRKHSFSYAELELEQVFAKQIEVVIQNYLFLRGISDAKGRAWSVLGFQNIIQSLSSGNNLTRVLEELAQDILLIMDASNVILYQYFEDSNRFELPPVMRGAFQDKDALTGTLDLDSVAWKIVQGGQSRLIRRVSDEPIISGKRLDNPDRKRFVEREDVKSTAILILRAQETREIVGLMFVNYCVEHEFGVEEEKTVNALASSVAMAIKTTRLNEQVTSDLKRRKKELEALHIVDEAIIGSAHNPDRQQVLELILERALEIIGAPIGYIAWLDKQDNILKLIASRGIFVGVSTLRWNLREGIIGQVAQTGKCILIHDLKMEKWNNINTAVSNTRSVLAVPLIDETGMLGVLSIEHPESGAFNENDTSLLQNLAIQTIIAVHSIDLYKEQQEVRKQREELLMTLAHEINIPIQGILADADNIKNETPLESDLRKLANHCFDQVLQLQLLTENVMMVLSEGIPATEFAVHSIYRPIKDACDMFRSEAAEKGCDIVGPRTSDPQFPDIEMSPFELTLAFKNLVHNAVKYSFYREKHYIRITGHWTDEQQEKYSISIQNYGVGITEKEIRERLIFDPYTRGEKASERGRTGKGFGLAFASRIIEKMHHGTITVTSKPQGGDAYLTTFTVTLPLKQPGSKPLTK